MTLRALSLLEARVLGSPLEKVRIQSPSLLKSVTPRPDELEGRRVEAIRRLGTSR